MKVCIQLPMRTLRKHLVISYINEYHQHDIPFLLSNNKKRYETKFPPLATNLGKNIYDKATSPRIPPTTCANIS